MDERRTKDERHASAQLEVGMLRPARLLAELIAMVRVGDDEGGRYEAEHVQVGEDATDLPVDVSDGGPVGVPCEACLPVFTVLKAPASVRNGIQTKCKHAVAASVIQKTV